MIGREPFPGAALLRLAATFSNSALALGGLAARHRGVVRRLSKYSLPGTAAALGGMLTRPDMHSCTARLEALGHLGALACKGRAPIPAANLRDWLNEALLRDDVARTEDPPEDVFVSCVASWCGTSRIFEGIWEANDFYLQSCLAALQHPSARSLVKEVFGPIRALLRLSDAVAERSGLERQAAGGGTPRARIAITRAAMAEHGGRVTFDKADLDSLEITEGELRGFVFDPDCSGRLLEQRVGHTDLERRPLVGMADGAFVLALPTAVSPAIRRMVLDAAEKSGGMDGLQSGLADDQLDRLLAAAISGWDIEPIMRPSFRPTEGVHEFFAEFDSGAFAHVVLVHDDLRAARASGLQAFHEVGSDVDSLVSAGATELRARPGYRRGLTILVHGGIGRGFAAGFTKPSEGWYFLPISLHDFVLLGRAPGNSAVRAWKLLRQIEEVRASVELVNPGGFVNMYAYAESQDFELVPPNVAAGVVYIGPNFVLDLRMRMRRDYDHHAARSFDGDGWLEVERRSPQAFFEAGRNLPLFVVPQYAALDVLAGCTETVKRTFWVLCRARPPDRDLRSFVFQVWDMALQWLPRAAEQIESLGLKLPDLISFELEFSKLGELGDRMIQHSPLARPTVQAAGALVTIGCGPAYLASFASPENLGDRWMVGAFLAGASQLAGTSLGLDELEALVEEVMRGFGTRFFHTVPAASRGEEVHIASALPAPRLVQLEDLATSRFELARLAGFNGPARPLSGEAASDLLGRAVDVLWFRIRDSLNHLDRASTIQMAMTELEAVEKERSSWGLTASAVIALYGSGLGTMRTFNQRESDRSRATTSLRVLVEMAVCAAPVAGGFACSSIDLDALCADIAVLIEMANVKDALYYRVAEGALVVNPNMTLGVEATLSLAFRGGYLEARGSKSFVGAANAYADRFSGEQTRDAPTLDSEFTAAWSAEFGSSLENIAKVIGAVAELAVQTKSPVLRMLRSQVLNTTATALGGEAANAARVVDSLSLRPRPRWDEAKPQGASSRDWYPWKYGRRLSLTRRPLVQITYGDDPEMLVSPAMLERGVRHLAGAYAAQVPGEMFDTQEMRRWIGKAIDRAGHEFNVEVCDKFRSLGFSAEAEVMMPMLGGTNDLGDIDVLAWRPGSNTVFAAECKRLSQARTIGEIGERLKEYTEISPRGRTRTPVQRHLDRIAYLRVSLAALSRFTGISTDGLVLKSCLVTHDLVPMQFSPKVASLIDIVTDLDGLAAAVG